MKVLFIGGGSIGHIAPAVAVWRAVERMQSDAVMHFACSERPEEKRFLERETIPFTTLPGLRLSILRPDIALRSFIHARRLLRDFQPGVIFIKGGALSIPICFAARLAGIPIVLHESDAVMGRANRLISKWATTVCLGFAHTGSSRQSTVVTTGNPIRPGTADGDRTRGLALTGFTGSRPILLVIGGSQGALALNQVIERHLDALLALVDIIHLTGEGKGGGIVRPGYWSRSFAFEELPDLYAIVDLALSRSGAGGISELAACGIPTLLVPLRGLAQDHQLHNARTAEQSGGCLLLDQDDLDRTLVPTITRLTHHPDERQRMRNAIRALSIPDAAERIAEILLEGASPA